MASPRSRSNRLRVLVLGAANVGKTAFVVRLMTKRFIGEYDSNKETMYTHRFTSPDRDEILLDILDSANSADDNQLEANIKWADGFILLYSVTDRQSFLRVELFLSQIFQLRRTDDPSTPGPAIVLAANKVDCPPDARRVRPEDGQILARRIERPLYELSVADGPQGVAKIVEDVVRQMRQREHLLSAAASAAARSTRTSGSGGGGTPSPGSTDRLSTFTNVKRVLKEKIYKGSRSDTWMVPGLDRMGK